MKTRIFALALLAVVSLSLFVHARQAQARIAPPAALDGLFAEINAGWLDAAAARFSGDAVARDVVRSKIYRGPAEIRAMLAGRIRQGRRWEVISVVPAGEQLVVTAQVSDRGLVWATEKFLVTLEDGKIQTFKMTGVALEVWRLDR